MGIESAFRALAIAASLASSVAAANAESWISPQFKFYGADWHAARLSVPVLPPAPDKGDPLTALTSIAADVFPSIGNSPVPVLLPFAVSDYAHERAVDLVNSADAYMFGFEATRFFLVGPTGYDAAFAIRTREIEELQDIGFAHPVIVQISGFNTLYELPPANAAQLRPSPELERQFPGLRGQVIESWLRYSFERFGIPYVVSIQCFDGPQRKLRLSCSNAERVGKRFLRALRLAGGNPESAPPMAAPAAPARPQAFSNTFAYHPAGKLRRGTAMRAADGDSDPTVYARIRFPVAEPPAFVHSERFGRRRVKAIAQRDDGARPLPWRDNFCERRHFFVARCPSGLGHQGQDIRGPSCHPAGRATERCRANVDAVVAARRGMVLREAWNDAVFLTTNEAGERLRFRYLHMHPRRLDEDGIVSGRRISEGERLGAIGNFSRRAGLTSTHLHFELQVPTRAGWMRVNPYMTLVAAYEHLLGERGVEIEEPRPEPAASDAEAQSAATASAVLAAPAQKPAVKSDARSAKAKAKRLAQAKGKIKQQRRAHKATSKTLAKGKTKAKGKAKAAASKSVRKGRSLASASGTSKRR